MAEEKKQRFELRKIYVKDISFESPMAPIIFRQDAGTPTVDVQLNVRHEALGEDMYESIVTVTVSGKLEDKDAFLVEVQQAGVFEISGVDPDKGLVAALEVACPNMLFPFAREAVNDIVCKGGFPQLLLSPVYFETLYRQKARQQAAQAQDEGGAGEAAQPDGGGETH
jgi:preprotein translocase subunit SecB